MVRIRGEYKYADGDMVDNLLRQLRQAPPAGLLDGMDDMVIAMLAERRGETTRLQRMTAVAAVMSLGGGVFAGAAIGEPVAAAQPLSPLAPMSAIAPSALLDAQ